MTVPSGEAAVGARFFDAQLSRVAAGADFLAARGAVILADLVVLVERAAARRSEHRGRDRYAVPRAVARGFHASATDRCFAVNRTKRALFVFSA